MKLGEKKQESFTGADKWKLLPAFLSARGLVKQHIDSYNYLVTRDIQQIVMAQSNRRLTSDVDPKWFAEYENVAIGAPSYMDGMSPKELTPQICRVRDMTYAAPIYAVPCSRAAIFARPISPVPCSTKAPSPTPTGSRPRALPMPS